MISINQRKYRIWSNKLHRYYNNNESLNIILKPDGSLHIIDDNTSHVYKEITDYEFEHCTGRVDENKQLIYENDIIARKIQYYDSNLKKIVNEICKYVVVWNNNCYQIINMNDKTDIGMIWCSYGYFIIGNIHNNIGE